MACDGGAVFKVVLLILCVCCLVYKRFTDNEALRVFYQLEKLSREWPLLNNITWDENGALLADVTFGGFTIITLGLLIGQLCGELRRARRMVCFFLILGCIMFLAVGGLSLAALDQVPHHLVDNAIVLGVLAVLTGLLFLIDLAFTGNKRVSSNSSAADINKKSIKMVSTPSAPIMEEKPPKENKEPTKEFDEKSKKNVGNGVLKELRSSLKRKKTVEDLDGRGVVVERPDRNVDFEPDRERQVMKETARLEGRSEDGRQHGRRGMENRGFPRSYSDDSGRFSSDRFRHEQMDAEADRKFDRDFDRLDSRNVSVVEGTYDSRRSPPPSMLELELDEHYLRPQDYYVEKKQSRDRSKEREKSRDRERERERVREKEREREREKLHDYRISSSRRHSLGGDLSDPEELQSQLPSVSFLLSERGRKVLPSVSTSPVERLHEATKPRYYFNSARDPASGSSAPPSPAAPLQLEVSSSSPGAPRRPGYVLHTASHWEEYEKNPTTVSGRLQHWFKRSQVGKAP